MCVVKLQAQRVVLQQAQAFAEDDPELYTYMLLALFLWRNPAAGASRGSGLTSFKRVRAKRSARLAIGGWRSYTTHLWHNERARACSPGWFIEKLPPLNCSS